MLILGRAREHRLLVSTAENGTHLDERRVRVLVEAEARGVVHERAQPLARVVVVPRAALGRARALGVGLARADDVQLLERRKLPHAQRRAHAAHDEEEPLDAAQVRRGGLEVRAREELDELLGQVGHPRARAHLVARRLAVVLVGRQEVALVAHGRARGRGELRRPADRLAHDALGEARVDLVELEHEAQHGLEHLAAVVVAVGVVVERAAAERAHAHGAREPVVAQQLHDRAVLLAQPREQVHERVEVHRVQLLALGDRAAELGGDARVRALDHEP